MGDGDNSGHLVHASTDYSANEMFTYVDDNVLRGRMLRSAHASIIAQLISDVIRSFQQHSFFSHATYYYYYY